MPALTFTNVIYSEDRVSKGCFNFNDVIIHWGEEGT